MKTLRSKIALVLVSGVSLAAFVSPTHFLTPSASKSDQELLARAAHAFNDIATQAMPAVVSIAAIKSVDPRAEMGMMPMPGGAGPESKENPLLDPHAGGKQPMLGLGSGVVIRPDGFILTNNHVVEDAEKLTVTFDEKHKSSAHIVGTDPKTDLAVIQVDEKVTNLPTLVLGNSDQLKVGDWAIAIGSPFGLNRTVTTGIISAKGRAQMGIIDTEDFIQTDAAINPGSSGGPLLSSNGEVIGLNTAIFSQSGGFMGIGFAIPANIAKEISNELIAHGKITRGYVGLAAQDLDEGLSNHFKVKQGQGALISNVAPEGPAYRSELKAGDVVTKYNNELVDNSAKLKALVGKSKAGVLSSFEVVRNGRPQLISIQIEEQPSKKIPQQAGQAAPKPKADSTLGLAVEELPVELARFMKLPAHSGVLITGVKAGSAAFDSGLAPGDVVLKADDEDVKGAVGFAAVAKKVSSGGTSVFYVARGPKEKVFVAVKG